MKTALLTAAFLCAMQPLAAQLQLSALEGLAAKAKESAEINLDAATLQLANGFLGNPKGKDGKALELLSKVKAIQVRTYEFRSKGEYDAAIVPAIRRQLQSQGWTVFVNMNDAEDGETFELYSRTENGRSTGFAMVAAEAKELAVIYIDGDINLSEIAGLGGQFGIPRIPFLPKDDPKKSNDKKGKE